MISGHLDGSIYLCNLETKTHKKLISSGTVPYSLAYGKHIVYSGNDGIVNFMGPTGNVIQRFDYSDKKNIRDFTKAYFNSIGETVVLLNYSCFVVFCYNNKR